MPDTCPHCGKELEEKGNPPSSYQASILDAFMGEYGGPDRFGTDMADDMRTATAHQKMIMRSQVLRVADSVDRANATRQFRAELSASEERGALLEYALELVQHDPKFLGQLLKAMRSRGLLGVLNGEDVIETEFVRIEQSD